ncbi:hypothetical protein Trydic_g17104 [Trypoxylus dichotomus]
MASSSKELITNTEFEKLLCGEDDDFCDTDFNLESNVDSDHESIDSHDSNSIIEASESDDGYDASEFEEKLYIGKDKVSEWSAIPPPTSQMQRQNIVYLGNQPEGPYKVSYSPEDIVTRLIKPIDESGRNITIDNWYASIPLATRLLSENKLTVVGTLCKNKSEVPSAFLPNKNRAIKSTLFGFTDTTTLVSYVPKKSKAVLLLSTMHHDAAIDNEIGEEKQPEKFSQRIGQRTSETVSAESSGIPTNSEKNEKIA